MLFFKFFFLTNCDGKYIIENKSSDEYALCYTDKDGAAISFLVFDFSSDSVVYRGKITQGTVKWISEYDVEVVEFPGIITKTDDSPANKYIYNVVRRSKL